MCWFKGCKWFVWGMFVVWDGLTEALFVFLCWMFISSFFYFFSSASCVVPQSQASTSLERLETGRRGSHEEQRHGDRVGVGEQEPAQ